MLCLEELKDVFEYGGHVDGVKVVGKDIGDVTIALAGAGASATAVARLLGLTDTREIAALAAAIVGGRVG